MRGRGAGRGDGLTVPDAPQEQGDGTNLQVLSAVGGAAGHARERDAVLGHLRDGVAALRVSLRTRDPVRLRPRLREREVHARTSTPHYG